MSIPKSQSCPYNRFASCTQIRNESPMTLIFALLRDDHIIFASDRRHVQGHENERYRNDDCWKTEAILGKTAMLGFAGYNIVEQVVESLKRDGDLERGSIGDVARKVGMAAQEKLKPHSLEAMPPMEFLVTGFLPEGGKSLATAFILDQDSAFTPYRYSFSSERGHKNYCLIGKHRHGALYIFLKCAKEMKSIEAGVRLACFTLDEVGKYEIGVGGPPQVCIIRPREPVEDKSDHLEAEMKWVAEKSEKIREIITS